MTLLSLLLACGDGSPVWALQHLEVQPTATGLTGTQTWEFFGSGWSEGRDDSDFVCARAQTVVGDVRAAPQGCPSCTVAYVVSTEEIDSDCAEPIATAATYAAGIRVHAIGEVPADLAELDPHPGRSMGWYASFDAGETLTAYGFAYDAALDRDETPGPPGWTSGGTYVLWAAYAWDIGK
jgi:hypothetical protein